MQVQQLKNLLIKIMLACIVAACVVAVIAILVGDMGDFTGKALGTLASALFHTLVLFGIISINTSKNEMYARSSNILVNGALIIAVLSFFTTVFNMWGALDNLLGAKLFVTYFVALISLLHVKTLMDVHTIQPSMKWYVTANYVFVALVAGLILGLLYLPSDLSLIDTFYGRLLAASAVVDVTLTAVIAIMNRLFIQKHPELQAELQSEQPRAGSSVVKVLILMLLFFFVVLPAFGFVGSYLFRGMNY